MAKAVKDPMDLVEMFAAAGEAELASITARVGKLRAELKSYTEKVAGEIRSLNLIRRSIEWKLHGTPQRKQRRSSSALSSEGPGGQTGSELQIAIHDLLMKEGSMPVPAIAERLKKSPVGVGVAIAKSPWFVRTNGEVSIAVKS